MRKKKGVVRSNPTIPISIILGILVGFVLGVLITLSSTKENPSLVQLRKSGLEYINPLIDFEFSEPIPRKSFNRLEEKIDTYLFENSSNKEQEISLYYKDLNSGAWLGINEDKQFQPASLFKVPLLISIYKISEKNPEILNTKIVYNLNPSSEVETMRQELEPEVKLIPGKEYTLDEILNHLIIYSDNKVLQEVGELIDSEDLEELYKDLGIKNPSAYDSKYEISARDYASFFRILYNATYLNKELSSKALELLTRTTYAKGLRQGVPENVKIAKKFGERVLYNIETGEKLESQLHDCGLIYHPQKPYILCIMTRGQDLSELEKTIQDISSIVYNTISQ
jgi:beta-lactamase class A